MGDHGLPVTSRGARVTAAPALGEASSANFAALSQLAGGSTKDGAGQLTNVSESLQTDACAALPPTLHFVEPTSALDPGFVHDAPAFKPLQPRSGIPPALKKLEDEILRKVPTSRVQPVLQDCLHPARSARAAMDAQQYAEERTIIEAQRVLGGRLLENIGQVVDCHRDIVGEHPRLYFGRCDLSGLAEAMQIKLQRWREGREIGADEMLHGFPLSALARSFEVAALTTWAGPETLLTLDTVPLLFDAMSKNPAYHEIVVFCDAEVTDAEVADGMLAGAGAGSDGRRSGSE
jgi:hypothetical protein